MAFWFNVKTYYRNRLGGAWLLYLIGAVSSFVAVVALAFYEAHRIAENKSKSDFSTTKHAEDYFNALGGLTIVASVCTLIDFLLMSNGDLCRLTPITITTGTLATFLGIVLWSLNAKKNIHQTTTWIFILQSLANSVQLAAIFNTHDHDFPQFKENDDLNKFLI